MDKRVFAVVVLLATGAGTPLMAQTYVRAECRPLVRQAAFDNSQHGEWYRRFWTGDCGSLMFCSPGSPSWNEVVSTLRARAPSARAAQVTRRACLLGQRIGHEWARDNAVRRIDTAALTSYVSIVQAAGDVEGALSRVEASVNGRLGTR